MLHPFTIVTGLCAVIIAAAPLAAAPLPVESFAAAAATSSRSGPADLASVVRCFARSAAHPSFAHLSESTSEASYQLRMDGLVFETIHFASEADGGTRAEIHVSGSAKDRARFEALRGRPLDRCLAGQSFAAMQSEGAAR